MDQKFISGIGNIYASEILYLAKINPNKISYKLSFTDVERLYLATKKS